MVQPSSRRTSEPGPVQQQLQETAAAAAVGDVSGSRGPDSTPGLHKKRQQQQQHADASDVVLFEGRQQNSVAGGVGQVVQDLIAAQGRPSTAGSSRQAGATGAAAGAAAAEAVSHPPSRR
jgi:hypothetical protein